MNKLSVFFLLAAGSLAALPARAELVIFQEGSVVKAASYRVVGEELEIALPGGGSYRVDLSRVDRIVDDEVGIADVSVVDPGDGKPANYDLSYREDRKPLFNTP